MKKNKPTSQPTIEEQQQLLNLYNQCLFVEAVAEAEKMVVHFPDCVFAWKILGSLLQNLGRTVDALVAKRKAVELAPNDVEAHNNLAVTFKELKLFDEAEKSCLRALEINPDFASAYCNLGNVFQEQENFSEAEKCYKQALKIDSTSAEFHNNLGAVLKKQYKNKEAEASYRQALAINSNFPDALGNLAKLLFLERRYVEADSIYQNSLRYAKNQPDFNNSIFTHLHLCYWDKLKINLEKLATYFEVSNVYTCNPFAILSFTNFNGLDSKKASYLLADKEYKNKLAKTPLTTKITHSHKKLRIGYLSADFHTHATVYLMAGVLENRNTENFDVYLYSYGIEAKDNSRSRVEKACEVFRNICELSDDEAAQQIVADEIDILVDLKGYTAGSRLGIQALRPAPIVVSWLGYPATLGHERLADYIIGDATVTPLKHAEHFSETLALMPHCYQPNDNTRPIGACPTRAEAGLPENTFVFSTFNQAYKITPEMFDIWCKLLIAAPNSVLWILEPIEVAQENLRREMTARGVNSSRLIFAPKMEQTAHLGRLQLVDLAVDTFPYTSHTTASDALWAGVPLVTKMGKTFASRVAASILRTMDLAELVTTNDDDYFNVALNLAQNPEKLAAIKQKIVTQKLISPLFDTEKFARDLEQLYQTIWAQELKGERKAVVFESEAKHEFHPQFITDDKGENKFVILPFAEWEQILTAFGEK
jgi:predicted O-linked N-acetylglucosamine transferase (SPINDLY family)